MRMRTAWTLAALAVVCVAGAQAQDGGGRVRWEPGGIPVADPPNYGDRTVVVPDGAGGVWVAWHDTNPRVQRLGADGSWLLGAQGTTLSAQTTEWWDGPAMVRDDAGGVIVAWMERRADNYVRTFVQRVDGSGQRLWDAGGGDLDGIALTVANDYVKPIQIRLAADGDGGAIVAWAWAGRTLTMQRLGPAGVREWGPAGVSVFTADEYLWDWDIAADGAGGAYAVWSAPPASGTETTILATRLDGGGAVAAGWPTPSLTLCAATGQQVGVKIASDGADGLFVTWFDARSQTDDPPLYGQRLRPDGSLPWGVADGRMLAARTNSTQTSVGVAPDGGGGFLASWQLGSGEGNDTNVQAQRFDADGDPQWNAGDPVVVCNGVSSQLEVALAPDGQGGGFVAWKDLRNADWANGQATVRAQRLGADGALRWGDVAEGLVLSGPPSASAHTPVVVSPVDGAAVVVWRTMPGYVAGRPYAQRVEDAGGVASEWVIVRKVVSTRNAKKPALNRLTLTASLDTGADPAPLTAPVTLTVGEIEVAIPALTKDRKGVLRYRGGGADVAVTPTSYGSSRCALTVKLSGDQVALVPADGRLDVGFACGDVKAAGGCMLTKGRYGPGGDLPDSAMRLSSAKATLLGSGTDSFSASFVFAPAQDVTSLGDVVFAFGETYTATVPESAISRKGRVFSVRGIPGVRPAVTVNMAKGVATVSATKVDLGTFSDGAQTVRLVIGSVGDEQGVEVRMVKTGRTLRY